jgi:putative ABC transport system ATP-binding protein
MNERQGCEHYTMIEIQSLKKRFQNGEEIVTAIDDVSLTIK